MSHVARTLDHESVLALKCSIEHIETAMFDSVLARRNVPTGKLASAGVSAGIYGVLILAVFFGVSQTRKEVVQPVEVKLFTAAPAQPAPPPPPPPPAGGAHKAVEKKPVEKKPVEKKPDTVVEPKVETKPEEPTTTDDKPSDAAGVPGGVVGGVPGGVVGGVLGGVPGGVVGGVPGGVPGGTGNAVLPFGAGMTRPQQISGSAPSYTPQAMAARVEGKLLVRCVITAQGTVQNCNVIKGLPMLDQTVLTALTQSRFTPVVYQGRPVAVQYLFTFNFKLP
jgi:protein TonB